MSAPLPAISGIVKTLGWRYLTALAAKPSVENSFDPDAADDPSEADLGLVQEVGDDNIVPHPELVKRPLAAMTVALDVALRSHRAAEISDEQLDELETAVRLEQRRRNLAKGVKPPPGPLDREMRSPATNFA